VITQIMQGGRLSILFQLRDIAS